MNASLVGIPYVERGRTREGADCWGVCLIAARELFGLSLPEYFYAEADLLDGARDLIAKEIAGPHWRAASLPCAPGAIHIFRVMGYEVHCGIDLGGGDFLHTLKGRDSCVESLRDPAWIQRRTGTFAWTA